MLPSEQRKLDPPFSIASKSGMVALGSTGLEASIWRYSPAISLLGVVLLKVIALRGIICRDVVRICSQQIAGRLAETLVARLRLDHWVQDDPVRQLDCQLLMVYWLLFGPALERALNRFCMIDGPFLLEAEGLPRDLSWTKFQRSVHGKSFSFSIFVLLLRPVVAQLEEPFGMLWNL